MRHKKALAVILAIAMVFGLVSLASAEVVAGGFADAAESPQAKQLAYLKAVGIAKGDEKGNYNPNAELTRQEFATFVARLAKQQAASDFLRSTRSRYLDDSTIADWARGEVNLADANGWVKGRDDGKFHPGSNLTYAEAVTVLVRMLGYEPAVKGAWPDGHVIEAINRGITAGVALTDKNKNTPISREDMGRMLYNSMFLPTMKHVLHDQYDETAPALYAGNSARGTVSAVTGSSITIGTADPRDFADDLTVIGFSASALNSLLGQTVRVHWNSNGKVFVVMLEGDVKLGSALAFDKFTTEATAETNWKTVNYIVFKDGSKVKYDPATTSYSVNGTGSLKPPATGPFNPPRINALPAAATPVSGDWMIVTESDGVATHVDITKFHANSALLTADGKARTKSTEEDRIAYGVTRSVGGAIINLNGEAASVTDLKTDDVVNVAYRLEYNTTTNTFDNITANGLQVAYHVEATRKVVEGSFVSKRTRTESGTTTHYLTIKLADGTNQEFEYALGPVPAYVGGSSVKLILDANDAAVKDLSGQSALVTNAYKVLGGENDGVNFRVQIDHQGDKLWVSVNAAANTETVYNTILGGGSVQYLAMSAGGQITGTSAIKWTVDGAQPAAGDTNVADFTDAVWDPSDAGYEANRLTLPQVLSGGEVVIITGPLLSETNPAVYTLGWADATATAIVGDAASATKDARVLTGYNTSNERVAFLVVPAK